MRMVWDCGASRRAPEALRAKRFPDMQAIRVERQCERFMRWVRLVELKFVFDERNKNRLVAHAAGSAGRGKVQSTRGCLPRQRAAVESQARMPPKSLSGIVSAGRVDLTHDALVGLTSRRNRYSRCAMRAIRTFRSAPVETSPNLISSAMRPPSRTSRRSRSSLRFGRWRSSVGARRVQPSAAIRRGMIEILVTRSACGRSSATRACPAS
jgi:hypothetical protein